MGREWACSGAIRLLDEHGNEVPDGEVGELFREPRMCSKGTGKTMKKPKKLFAVPGVQWGTWRGAIRMVIFGWSTGKAT